MVHCKEPLDWVEAWREAGDSTSQAELLGISPMGPGAVLGFPKASGQGAQLTLYEKCGEEPTFSSRAEQT